MASDTLRRLRRRWNAKHSITAAMLVLLVLIAVTASISVSLAPAHLSFCITKANIATYIRTTEQDIAKYRYNNSHLNFTLVATNTSPRTAVRYSSMAAKVWFGPAAAGAWVRTPVRVPDGWQPPRAAVRFNVSADYGYLPDDPAMQPRPTEDTRVVVESKLRFGNGLVATAPFIVRFSCWHVNFVDSANFPILCGPV